MLGSQVENASSAENEPRGDESPIFLDTASTLSTYSAASSTGATVAPSPLPPTMAVSVSAGHVPLAGSSFRIGSESSMSSSPSVPELAARLRSTGPYPYKESPNHSPQLTSGFGSQGYSGYSSDQIQAHSVITTSLNPAVQYYYGTPPFSSNTRSNADALNFPHRRSYESLSSYRGAGAPASSSQAPALSGLGIDFSNARRAFRSGPFRGSDHDHQSNRPVSPPPPPRSGQLHTQSSMPSLLSNQSASSQPTISLPSSPSTNFFFRKMPWIKDREKEKERAQRDAAQQSASTTTTPETKVDLSFPSPYLVDKEKLQVTYHSGGRFQNQVPWISTTDVLPNSSTPTPTTATASRPPSPLGVSNVQLGTTPTATSPHYLKQSMFRSNLNLAGDIIPDALNELQLPERSDSLIPDEYNHTPVVPISPTTPTQSTSSSTLFDNDKTPVAPKITNTAPTVPLSKPLKRTASLPRSHRMELELFQPLPPLVLPPRTTSLPTESYSSAMESDRRAEKSSAQSIVSAGGSAASSNRMQSETSLPLTPASADDPLKRAHSRSRSLPDASSAGVNPFLSELHQSQLPPWCIRVVARRQGIENQRLHVIQIAGEPNGLAIRQRIFTKFSIDEIDRPLYGVYTLAANGDVDGGPLNDDDLHSVSRAVDSNLRNQLVLMRNPSAPPSPTPNNVDNAIDDGSDAGYSNVSHDDPEDGSSKIRNPFLKLATIFEKPKTGFRKNSIDRGIGNMFEEPAGFDPSGPPDSAESSQSSMRADSAKKLEQFFGEEFNKGSSKNASQGPRSTRRKKTRGESKMKTTTSKRQSAKRRKSGKYIDMNDLLLYDEILEEDEQESDFSAHADKVELERPASEMIVDNLDAYFPDLKNGLELVIGEDVADSLVDEQKKPEAVDDLSKWDTERKALGSIRVETIKLNLRESLKARRNSRLDRRTNRVDRVAHRYQFEDLEEEHEHNLEVESTHDARDDESIHVIRPDSIRKDRLSNFDSSSTISVDTDQKSIRSVTEVWRDRIASISSEALFITEDASQVGTDPLRRTSTVGLGVGLWAAAAEGAERKRFRESEGTGLAGTGLLVRTSTGPRRRSDGTQPWTKLKEEVLRKPFLGDAVSDTLKRKNAVLQKRPDDVSLQAPDSGQKDAEKSSLVPPEVVIDKIVDSESESESEEETPIVQDDENVGVKGGTHGFAFVDGIEQEVDVGGLSPAAEAVASVGAAPLQVKWVRGKLIGKGSFGRVYHGINLTNNMIMAVKQVEVAVPRKWKAPGIAGPFEPLDKMRQKMVDALTQEISLLKELNHENIVRYEGFAVEGNTISVFLEYVSGGSVATLLGSIGPFEEGMISSLVFQILSGLKYLHERCIIHRDIKGANILVDEQGLAKISDFGISKKNEHKMAYRYNSRMSLQGSVYWMAPEVVQQRGYSAKVDIWSLGCVVVEMFSGAHPWKQLDETQTMWQLGARHSPSLSEGVKASAEAREFLEQCFTIDPDQRPTAEQLLEHAFPDAHWATFDFASARAAGLERKRAEIMAHRENQKRARERMMQKRQQQRDRGAPMDVVGLMDLEISSDEYDSDVYTGSEFDSDDLVEDDSDREVEDEGEVDERDKEAEIEITYIGDNRTIVSDIAGSATMIPAIVKLSDRTNSLAIEPVVTVTSARFEQITNSRTTTQSPSSTIPSNNDPTTYGYGKDDTETYGFGKEARRDLEVTVGAGLVASARRGSRSGPTTPSTGSTTPTSITSAGSTPPTGTLAAITAATIVGVGTMFGEARFR